MQQEKPAGGSEAAVARSGVEGLSNKGLQSVLPGLTVQLKGMGGAVLDDTIARAIHSKRGTGETLDPGVAKSMGDSMGHDFSNVNVHRDAEADNLNKSVQAEAFTTGSDIFFRSGKYDPVSNEGQKLLAHELTHVVQQENAPPAQELRVSDPNEASEQQASSVAESVTSNNGGGGDAGVARQAMKSPDEESETSMHMSADRAESEGEEEQGEQMAMTQVARDESAEKEEEEAATQVARDESAEKEEEEAATQVARAEGEEGEKEEEEAATQVARDHAEDEENETQSHAM